MAFFGLTDITFKDEKNQKGPLASLYTSPERNVGNAFRYPIDIGNSDKGHYMVIHINEQKNSQLQGIQQTLGGPTSLSSSAALNAGSAVKNIKEKFTNSINSAIDNGVAKINKATNGALSFLQSSSPSFSGQSSLGGYIESVSQISDKKLLNTTRKTTESIVLYMPDTIAFSSSQNYEQLELGKELAGKVGIVGASVIESIQKGTGDTAEKLKSAAKTALIQGATGAAGAVTNSPQTAQAVAFLAQGGVVNPQLELLYSSPNFRDFSFEFMFYPRDEREAVEVWSIIERLRFHQAPELLSGSPGLLLIPPSEFEIEFYYRGAINPNIPKIATCVLTSIDINYAPNGWSAYEMPGDDTPKVGRTGMPTAIQMTLAFKETIFLTKQSFANQGIRGIK